MYDDDSTLLLGDEFLGSWEQTSFKGRRTRNAHNRY